MVDATEHMGAGEAWGKETSNYAVSVSHSTEFAADQLVQSAEALRKIDHTSYVLDLGSGTGALALDVARKHPSTKILATDISAAMVESIEKLQVPNISTQVLDAVQLSTLGDEVFSHLFSIFMLQFVDQPDTVLSSAYNALQPGGVIGIGLWYENNTPFNIFGKACRTIDPQYHTQTEYPDPHAWTLPDQLRQHMEMAKFTDVTVTEIWMPFSFISTEAYMGWFASGKNPSIEWVVRQWTGSRDEAMEAVSRIVREEYGDGKHLKLHGFLGVGRKA